MTVDNTDIMDYQSVEKKVEEQDKLHEVLTIYLHLLDHGINVQLKYTNLPPRKQREVQDV